MTKWSPKIEEELTALLKDWLKSEGKSQVDLRNSLQASSSRMQSLIEVLKKDYSLGGIPRIADKLCLIENDWNQKRKLTKEYSVQEKSDPFNQLDLLLEELRENCTN